MQVICKQPVKGNLHILVFLNYPSGYLKFCKTFCLFEMAWSRDFQKCIIYHFLVNFFLQTFLLYNWILQLKNSNFENLQFFADSNSRAQELSKDVSFVIFRHQTCVSWFSSTQAGIGLNCLWYKNQTHRNSLIRLQL